MVLKVDARDCWSHEGRLAVGLNAPGQPTEQPAAPGVGRVGPAPGAGVAPRLEAAPGRGPAPATGPAGPAALELARAGPARPAAAANRGALQSLVDRATSRWSRPMGSGAKARPQRGPASRQWRQASERDRLSRCRLWRRRCCGSRCPCRASRGGAWTSHRSRPQSRLWSRENPHQTWGAAVPAPRSVTRR
jgi:hypothetical protein